VTDAIKVLSNFNYYLNTRAHNVLDEAAKSNLITTQWIKIVILGS
jgi:hypothetical protein